MKLSTHLNVCDILELGKKGTTLPITQFSSLLSLIVVVFARENFVVLSWISNFVLTRETLHQCVLINPIKAFHEWNIVNKITVLEASRLITDCEESEGSLLLLVANSHQENCMSIGSFVLWLCISYRLLNSITLNCELPIPRCIDNIEDLDDACGYLFMILFDASIDCHQDRIRKCDQEKLLSSLREG